MAAQLPGSFTSSIPAIVIPRNTSSDSSRSRGGRDVGGGAYVVTGVVVRSGVKVAALMGFHSGCAERRTGAGRYEIEPAVPERVSCGASRTSRTFVHQSFRLEWIPAKC